MWWIISSQKGSFQFNLQSSYFSQLFCINVCIFMLINENPKFSVSGN